MIRCDTCGKQNAASYNFCLDCGGELRPGVPTVNAPIAPIAVGRTPGPASVGERDCPACGKPSPASFSWCAACGSRLDEKPVRGGTMFLHAVAVATPRARLVSIRADGSEGDAFPVSETPVVVGSAGEVRFEDDPYVSPRHCSFAWTGGELRVEDLGALNGVFRKVRGELQLQPGDHLRIGRQLLRLEPMAPVGRTRADGTRIWGSPDPGYQARLLQMLEGGGIGEVFPLKSGDNLLGREQGDVTFPADRFVSGRHAVIEVEGESFRLRDLGSSNGTYVRLNRPTALEAGDFLLIGNQLLRVDLR